MHGHMEMAVAAMAESMVNSGLPYWLLLTIGLINVAGVLLPIGMGIWHIYCQEHPH